MFCRRYGCPGPDRRFRPIDQIIADIDQIRLLGAETALLDPFNGDLTEARQPERAWRAPAAVAAHHESQEDR
ncbi:hypothetical protein [Micromonospora sp. NPDC001898]|uniref:hypothetical protein n=1 Tax=Micromonospora sp. NPDC001898 TaxID=3364221 RepID=UPI0036BD5CB4